MMPFSLINAGTTYQRTATTLLHDMMRKKEEFYVDDKIVNSKEHSGHLKAFRKFFERLRKYKMRFNPQKYAFGVTCGKNFGHIVSHRGIKVDPSKIKSIMEIPHPENEKQIQGFLGREPLKAIKGRVVADFLDDNPIEEVEIWDTWTFPDEDVIHIEDDVWDLYFDRAPNYMGYGVGILLISPKGEHIPVSIKFDFNVTNNVAEYEAYFLGLRSALDLGVKKLLVHGDSSLVIKNVFMSWKIKSDSLASYQARIEELERYFDDVKHVHLSGDEDQFADALSKLAALINIPEYMDRMPISVERRSSPSYVNAIDDTEESEAETWYMAIIRYKEMGECPIDLDARGKRALRILASQFVKTDDGQLYKRMAQGVLLRCVDKLTAEKDQEVGLLLDNHGHGLSQICQVLPELLDFCKCSPCTTLYVVYHDVTLAIFNLGSILLES
ncbi:uncharacterized protein LOC141614472 [Silene latifolia]|uniref:uncharacterized protein LOC141614472 n=1 Tax=Silene latifolia TaxID=37657 RepID=UPI003D775AAC